MKRYKLLRDLPTFKAGDEFYLSENGELVFNGGNIDEVAYCHRELEKFPNILKDWFEEVPEKYKRWRAGVGEPYFYYDIVDGYATRASDFRSACHNAAYAIGNYFKTKEEAEKYGEYLKALQVIKDDAKGFKPDWEDDSVCKYCGVYNFASRELGFNDLWTCKVQGAVFFETQKDIEASFKKHRKEWLIVLGVEDEDND